MNRRNLEKKIKILKLDVRDTEALLEKFSDFKSSGLTQHIRRVLEEKRNALRICLLAYVFGNISSNPN